MSFGGDETVVQVAATSAAVTGLLVAGATPAVADGPYFLPDLPFPYDALEPHIDTATMKVRHLEAPVRFAALFVRRATCLALASGGALSCLSPKRRVAKLPLQMAKLLSTQHGRS